MMPRTWIPLAVALALFGCDDQGTAEPATPPGPTPATEAPAPPAEPAGPMVQDDAYEVRADAAGSFQSGEAGRFGVTLTPRGGWHVNLEYPMSIEVHELAGVAFPKRRLEREDAAEYVDERAHFDVPFTAADAGEHRVQADVSFAVCNPESCLQEDITLAVLLPVE